MNGMRDWHFNNRAYCRNLINKKSLDFMISSMKIAVVTGAASGIGKCTVERLLAQNWQVFGLDISAPPPASHSAFMQVVDRYRYVRCDVTNSASVRDAFSSIANDATHINALICSAGVVRPSPLMMQSEEEVDLMLGVNLKGPWLTTKAALFMLQKKSSVADPTRIVYLGSIAGIRPKSGGGFYAASKAALHVFTGVLAVELGPTGITVNAVAPGTVETPMVTSLAKSAGGYKVSGESPLGRIAEADDVVDVIMFFLSDAAKYVNGTVLPVDGGTRAAFLKA
jgi:NAD(P)-dependent dehydrogenase (short-subunit alcohol dehydrogenase family)